MKILDSDQVSQREAVGHDNTAPSPRPDHIGIPTRRIDEVIIPAKARAHTEADVRNMADSLEELGQLSPILVTPEPDNKLKDGSLRLAAAKFLGWNEVEVKVINLDELRTELAGIDANLIRVELTTLERAECLLRRKEIYELLHPETKYGSSEMMKDVRRGGNGPSRQPSFAADAATKMGCDPGTVQRLVKIAGNLPVEVRDLIRTTPVATIQSDLQKLSLCPEGEQRRIAEQLSTGELTKVPKNAGRTRSWTPPDPEAVLLRAERALTRHLSRRPDADVAAIPTALKEIELARSVWTPPDTDDGMDIPPNLSLEEIAALPAGQLEPRWVGSRFVQISRAGTPIAHIAVRRGKPSDKSFIKPNGNVKTAGTMGMLNSCSQGCGRLGTGLVGCGVSCYTDADGKGGCYCSHFASNMRSEFRGSDVIANGLVNDLMRITLPADGNASLGDRVPQDRKGEVMTWRVDCESSTGDLSISLGVLHVWAESNPDQSFATICSNHFRPSDAMLAWLAALDNVVVGPLRLGGVRSRRTRISLCRHPTLPRLGHPHRHLGGHRSGLGERAGAGTGHRDGGAGQGDSGAAPPVCRTPAAAAAEHRTPRPLLGPSCGC